MSKEVNILAVDDEADILKLLEYNLKKTGFSVLQAKDGPEAIEMAGGKRPDLILLDVMLPNMEGTEVLRRLKANAKTANIPVIMLTAKGEEIDRVVGLELGAEDYITKPFSPRELILRIRAVLKRVTDGAGPKEGSGAVFNYNELSIDTEKHKVTVKNKNVVLTSTEFKLLLELIGAKGRVLSRDRLLDRAWGVDCFVTPRTVDTHMRRLRVKLGVAGDYIDTVRGVGYRFRED